MEISNDVYTSVNKYFSVLSHMGYKPYNQVEELLILIFAEELLTGPMSLFISEEDYNTIDKALNCIYGSCMIDYPSYKKEIAEPIKKVLEEYRFTESGIIRATEDILPRTMS